MFPSKWSYFYSSPILWVITIDICPVTSVIKGVGGVKLERVVDYNVLVCARVHDAILAQNIYCDNTNPRTNTYSGYRVHKGLGDRYPRITQPVTCRMGLSIFAATSRLKVAN